MTKLFHRDDALTAALFIGFCILTSLANPAFFSIGTLFDLARSAIVPGTMAIGVLIVLLSGGIDVSFTAVAVLAMYASTKLVAMLGLGSQVGYIFALSMIFGLGLGLVNGFFVGSLRLPALIVTLGTLSVYRGILLTFVGTTLISTLPSGMRSFAVSNIVRIEAEDGSLYTLPTAFVVLTAAILGAWILLNRTTLGRCIYALGGSTVSAERIGINVTGMQYFVYGLAGVLAGAAGVVHACLNRVANPFDLVGLELSVIAAVVLGGTRISGGHGTILGTMLGVALVAVMNNTLILWGIPSTWQNVVIGVLILIGTGIPAMRNRRKAFV